MLKNSSLRFRTDCLTEAANDFEESYAIGHQLGEIGSLIRRMAIHISDLQKKVDSQAEELRRRQADDERRKNEAMEKKQETMS